MRSQRLQGLSLFSWLLLGTALIAVVGLRVGQATDHDKAQDPSSVFVQVKREDDYAALTKTSAPGLCTPRPVIKIIVINAGHERVTQTDLVVVTPLGPNAEEQQVLAAGNHLVAGVYLGPKLPHAIARGGRLTFRYLATGPTAPQQGDYVRIITKLNGTTETLVPVRGIVAVPCRT